MKIGILGGSFDPIHNGHLYMAKQAYMQFGLDSVIFIPAGHSPNKEESQMTSAGHRLAMCKIATEEYPEFSVSSIEMESTETSYTYRTLEKLSALYPMDKLYFLMGADSLAYFHKWKKPEKICQYADLLVLQRNEQDTKALEEMVDFLKMQFPCEIHLFSCDKYEVSSTEIRNKIMQNETPSDIEIPKNVLDYIKEKGLYQNDRDGMETNS